MNPAPGYDDFVPHDLLHFVVERALRIGKGLFGQLAAGGTAGTFRPIRTDVHPREVSRLARRLARRGARLTREGRDDSELSERAAQACHQAWMTRAGGGTLTHTRSDTQAGQLQPGELAESALVLTREQLDRACSELDELSAAWQRLKIGQALTLVWTVPVAEANPRQDVRPNSRMQRSRRT
jgi:hypothetical protein